MLKVMLAAMLLCVSAFAENGPVEGSRSCVEVWSPAGPVQLGIGENQGFGAGADCAGYTVTISPANGTAAFNLECSSYSTTTNYYGIFKVYGCDYGTVTVSIYTTSAHPQLLQTISVEVPLP